MGPLPILHRRHQQQRSEFKLEKGREFEFNVGQIEERFCADKEPDNLPNWKAGFVSCLFSLFHSLSLEICAGGRSTNMAVMKS